MKFFVALVGLTIIFSANALSEAQRTRAQSFVKQCYAEVGIDANDAKQLRAGNFADHTDKAQCFVLCYFKKTGYMNAAGEPQRELIIQKLKGKYGFKDDEVTKVIDECLKDKGKNTCETAFKIFQCYRSSKVLKASINSQWSTTSSPKAQGSSTQSSISKDGSKGATTASGSISSTTEKSNQGSKKDENESVKKQ